MLEHSGDLFKRRAAELGLERGDALAAIQRALEQHYPGQAKAFKLHESILYLSTTNSALTSEMRMQQQILVKEFSSISGQTITKIVLLNRTN